MDLDLKIARLVFPDGRQLQAGSGRLALDNGRLKANALQATLGGANVKLDGSINDPQNVAGLDLKVALQGGELAELFKFFGKSIPPAGPYQGRAQVHGSLDAIGMTEIDTTAGRPGQSVRATGQIEDAIELARDPACDHGEHQRQRGRRPPVRRRAAAPARIARHGTPYRTARRIRVRRSQARAGTHVGAGARRLRARRAASARDGESQRIAGGSLRVAAGADQARRDEPAARGRCRRGRPLRPRGAPRPACVRPGERQRAARGGRRRVEAVHSCGGRRERNAGRQDQRPADTGGNRPAW